MRRKRHEPILPEGLDEPFGPPPEEYLYRCPVCGEEMLVNEAIIDVAVGAAKFRGEYQGGMPKLGAQDVTARRWNTSIKSIVRPQGQGAAMGDLREKCARLQAQGQQWLKREEGLLVRRVAVGGRDHDPRRAPRYRGFSSPCTRLFFLD